MPPRTEADRLAGAAVGQKERSSAFPPILGLRPRRGRLDADVVRAVKKAWDPGGGWRHSLSIRG